MSNSTPTQARKKRFALSPLRLIDWIDNHKSETVRRVSHGLLVVCIASLCGLILTQREALQTWFESNSKSIWTLLKLPIQLQVWIVLLTGLIVVAAFWIFHSLFKKKPDKATEFIEAVIMEQKIRPKTYPKLPLTDEQIARRTYINKKHNPNPTDEIVRNHQNEIIQTIHEKLVDLKRAVEDVTLQKNPDSDRRKKQEKYDALSRDFQEYIQKNIIYLTTDLVAKIEDFRRTLQASLLQFNIAMANADAPNRTNHGTLFAEHFETTRKADWMHAALLNELRVKLGITNTPNIAKPNFAQEIKEASEMYKIKLQITATLSLEHTTNMHGLLTVKAVNMGKRIARVRQVQFYLTPVPSYPFGGVSMTPDESLLNMPQKQPVVDIQADDGMHQWELELQKNPNFLTHSKDGKRFGKGYIELTVGTKIEFEFLLLRDEDWNWPKSRYNLS